MRSEIELTEWIEKYLYGELSEAEQLTFEQRRLADAAFDQKVVAHQQFLRQLDEYGTRRKLIQQMDAVHEQLDIPAIKAAALPKSYILRTLWNKYRLNAAVAASVAIIAVLATMLTTGYFSKANAVNSNYSMLRREMDNIKRSQHAIIKNIKSESVQVPAEFEGTGFALTENGYIVTNYHVIEGAQSVSVQDNDGESYTTKIVHKDPVYDIAVLKITDTAFKAFKSLPYVFKKSKADVGENVFTIGYPKDTFVYGRGYLSSNTGHLGDTVSYQVSIDANDGNSGGPLLDDRGNVIGIINAKLKQADGATFAIKSSNLLRSIESIPEEALEDKIVLNKKNGLNGLRRTDQIKKLEDYIFMVKVY